MTEEQKTLLLYVVKRNGSRGFYPGWIFGAVDAAREENPSEYRYRCNKAEGYWESAGRRTPDPEAVSLGVPHVVFKYFDACSNCGRRKDAHRGHPDYPECPFDGGLVYYSLRTSALCSHCEGRVADHTDDGHCLFSPTKFSKMSSQELEAFINRSVGHTLDGLGL